MDRAAPRSALGLGKGRRALVALGVSAGGIVWFGCSVEKHYDLLSFFFDGVPNPNALPVTATAGDPISMRQSPTYVAHTPYVERQCDSCHRSRFDTSRVGAEVCLPCHEGVETEYRVMHGPVALGACLWCHVTQ